MSALFHPRYVRGHRLHHGVSGAGLVMLGLSMMLHDVRDWRVWFPDLWRRV